MLSIATRPTAGTRRPRGRRCASGWSTAALSCSEGKQAMNVPHRVVWSEGLLVSPQHLQQADLYHERLLDVRLAALTPQTWGILSLELDLGALQADQFRMSRFVGILPDGLHLGFEAGDAEAPAARPIGAHFPPAQPVLEVFLAVPKERDGVPSVAAEVADSSARPRPGFDVLASVRPPGRWAT
jgi:type VI secretion system protein ImpJ